MNFDDLKFHAHEAGLGGTRATLTCENGYGASVIQTPFSYGGLEGKYEVAVLNKKGSITYSTRITDDVLGWLSPEGVTQILLDIESLPSE